MKKLLSLFTILFIGMSSFSQTTPFAFTTIANAQPDFTYTPGRGFENWIGQNTVNIPVAGTNTQRTDAFYRFSWDDFQPHTATGAGTNMTFTVFDAQVHDAINKGQDFYFGIMFNFAAGDLGNPNHYIIIGGALIDYPTALHNAMQAESTKDIISGTTWYENTNSLSLRAWLKGMLNGIANHIATTSFNGVPYSSVVRRVDVRFMGDFGENIVLPDKTALQGVNGVPTEAAVDSLIDAYRQAFPDLYLVNMIGTFSAGFPGPSGVGATPANSGAFSLTVRNNKGLFGWRRDNWFRTDGYIHSLTNLNTNVALGVRFDTAIMNRWKYGIVTGEPELDDNNFDDANAFIADVTASHANSVGNGNVNGSPFNFTTALQNAFRSGSLLMGYRLLLTGGSSTTSPTPGGVMNITLNWQNVGLCPPYWAWNAQYELRNTAGTVVFTATSAFKPKFFMPSGTATVSNENFTLTGVVAGTYNLFLVVRDSTGYMAPMPLAITGRQSDGAYPLRQNIVIGGTSPVQANAGVDQTITLPTASVNLDGTLSTGVINSFNWTRISGPNTPSIVTPTSATTSVTGLIAGTYVFQLSVNGGTTGTLIDQVTIVVNPTPVLANAGPNQNITVPSVSLTGAASVGATTFLWTQISGPNTGTITTPTTVGTTVTGLITGTYVFQLGVNGGTTGNLIDQVTIVVAIPAVVANAGANQAIAPPTSSVTVNGSASTGTITSFLWTRISGPNTPTITTPTTVSTTITGLITGTYVFQLALNGGSTGTLIDQMTVTVSAAPVASAGPDQIIQLPTSTVTLTGAGSTGATTFAWTRISGPNTPTITTPNTVGTTVTGLIAGTYVFQLAINGGSTDQVTITVNPIAPVANAGNNQVITLPTSTVTLNGSLSTGATSFAWTRISGPNVPTITTPTTVTTTVTGLIAGTYVFQLSINAGVSTAQVTITVLPAIPPVANAGLDQTIVLPVDVTTISGSASTGPITTYTWTQISGKSVAGITSPNSVTTGITGLDSVGIYQFQLSVNGGASTDIVNINVNPIQTTFTILTTQTPGGALENDGPQGTLTGIELGVKFTSSVAGNIVGVRFYKQVGNTGTHIGELYNLAGTRLAQATFTGETASGWQTVTFATPIAITAGTIYIAAYFSPNGFYSSTAGGYTTAIVNPPLTGLANGTSGVNGLFRYANAPIVPNAGFGSSNYYIDAIMNTNVEVANAGGDQTITLPISTIILDGSASTGQYNSITWSQISGPNTATITSKANILTSVTGLIQGTYVFRLSLDGGTSTDNVTVAVNPAPVPQPSFNMRLTKLVNQ